MKRVLKAGDQCWVIKSDCSGNNREGCGGCWWRCRQGLRREGQMLGENITILEEQSLPGGALDGIEEPEKGFVIRGGREMENHFECLWDLFRSIPSLEIPNASVLDEFYWLNKDDPNYSLQRVTLEQGKDAKTNGLFTLSEIMVLIH